MNLLNQSFKFRISHLINSGLFEYWQQNEFRLAKIKESNKHDGNPNDNNGDRQNKSLHTVQLQSVFYSFMFFVGLSFLSLAIETMKLFHIKI